MKSSTALRLSCFMLLALAPCCFGAAAENAPRPQMVEGEFVTDTSSLPYHVGISYEGSTLIKCSGTLIDDNWVLTSAYCVSQGKNMNIHLSAIEKSSATVSPPTMIIGVSSGNAFQHPDYDSSDMSNDIGLIKLSLEFSKTSKYLKAIKYNKDAKKVFSGKGTVSGYGHNGSTDGYIRSTNLRKLDMDILTNTDCNDKNEDWSGLTANMMCTSSTDNNGPCQWDEGSPLVVISNKSPLLIGVYAYSPHLMSCSSAKVKVFTRTAPYDKWISKTMSSM